MRVKKLTFVIIFFSKNDLAALENGEKQLSTVQCFLIVRDLFRKLCFQKVIGRLLFSRVLRCNLNSGVLCFLHVLNGKMHLTQKGQGQQWCLILHKSYRTTSLVGEDCLAQQFSFRVLKISKASSGPHNGSCDSLIRFLYFPDLLRV